MMAAGRMKRLASLLWEDDDGEHLVRVWFQNKSSKVGAQNKEKLLQDQCNQLETENAKLKGVVAELQNTLPQPHRELCVSKPSLMLAKRRDPWYWLELLPDAIRNLERLNNEILPSLKESDFAEHSVDFDLPQSTLASAVISHGELTIRSLTSKKPCIYKVGVTKDPIHRWEFYKEDKQNRFTNMKVIYAHGHAHGVCFLEASLIRLFLGLPGNRNIRWGGEGLQEGLGPFFCYIVYRKL